MANQCSITGTIKCATTESARKLYRFLMRTKEEADRKKIGMYIGSERYLFDSEFDVTDDTIRIDGWVKWSLNDDEMIGFIRHCRKRADITFAEISYEECGCLLYGQYTFENDLLTDYYLPSDFFPDYEEGQEDDFCLLLEHALNEHGVYREIAILPPDPESIEKQE